MFTKIKIMKEALIYFLRELSDPYLLQQLLEIKDEEDEVIKDEIIDVGYDEDIETVFNNFKQLPSDLNIKIFGLENIWEGEEIDATPDFVSKQQLILRGCDDDLYLIFLPIEI